MTGLSAPWSIAFVGETALISERETGVIWELLDAGSLREIARIDDLAPTGEGGLLGLAAGEDERLYAYSSGSNGNRVQRFELAGAAGSYGLGAADTILDGLPYAGFHNGGRIAFGPDGMLYVCVGDATEGERAQDLGVLSGKILRRRQMARSRLTTHSLARSCSASAIGTCRASIGRPTARCSPASSVRTPGTS